MDKPIYDELCTRVTNGKRVYLAIPQDMSAEDWRLLSEYVVLQKEASFDEDDYDDRPVEDQVRDILARYTPTLSQPPAESDAP